MINRKIFVVIREKWFITYKGVFRLRVSFLLVIVSFGIEWSKVVKVLGKYLSVWDFR